MKNIIFIAPPAAGKGTQSDMLKQEYGYNHISTGDILREAITSGSELGKNVKNIIDNGQLVTDEIMINLIQEKLEDIKGNPF
ncbi:MAG: nucleoside monophosphate kinase, partial [Erysipelotrichaceae bacterium]